jgi:hypothetical protein
LLVTFSPAPQHLLVLAGLLLELPAMLQVQA